MKKEKGLLDRFVAVMLTIFMAFQMLPAEWLTNVYAGNNENLILQVVSNQYPVGDNAAVKCSFNNMDNSVARSGETGVDGIWDSGYTLPSSYSGSSTYTFTFGTIEKKIDMTSAKKYLIYDTLSDSTTWSDVPQQYSLISISQPDPITVPNGTLNTAEALGLPKTVKIACTIDTTTTDVPVVWDLSGDSYNPALTSEQTFTVSGSVTLPQNLKNPKGLSLNIQAKVTSSAMDNAAFDVQPADQILTIGDNLTLTASAVRADENTYAWYKDGTAFGVTGKTLSITNVGLTNAGKYSCHVMGLNGTEITSSEAQIIVNKKTVNFQVSVEPTDLQNDGTVLLRVTGLPSDATGSFDFIDDTNGNKIFGTQMLPLTTEIYNAQDLSKLIDFSVKYSGDSNYSECSESCFYDYTKLSQSSVPVTIETASIPANIQYQDVFTVHATGGIGNGNYTYGIADETDAAGNPTTGVAEIDPSNGVVTILKPGFFSITAQKGGDASYNVSVKGKTQSLEAKKKKIGLTLETSSAAQVRPAAITLTAAGLPTDSKFGGDFTFNYDNNNEISTESFPKNSADFCAIGNKDTYNFTVTFTGNDYYDSVTSDSVSYEFKKGTQTEVTFENLSLEKTYGDEAYNVTATGGSGIQSFVYGITNMTDLNGQAITDQVATIDSQTGLVTLLRSGKFSVTAYNQANDDYNASDLAVSQTITVRKAPQSGFEFADSTPDPITYNSINPYFIDMANGAMGEHKDEITYSVTSGDTVAEIADSTKPSVHYKSSGRAVITATVPGDDQYDDGNIQYNLTINKADPALSFILSDEQKNQTYGDKPFTVQASFKGNSDGFSYSIVYNTQKDLEGNDLNKNNAVAKIDAATGEITLLRSGSFQVRATRKTDSWYNEKYIDSSFITVKRISTRNDFCFDNASPKDIQWNDTNSNKFSDIAKSQLSPENITYSIVDGMDTATIDSATGTLSFRKAGTVTVQAVMDKDIYYDASTIQYSICMKKADQILAFNVAQPSDIYYGSAFINQAVFVTEANAADSIGHGENSITYSIDKAGTEIAGVDANGVLSFHNQKTGMITVTAHVDADERYNEAAVSYSLKVVYLPEPSPSYKISGNKIYTASDWYTGDITIAAPEGYQISYSNNLTDNAWKDSLVINTEGTQNAETVYLRHAADGATTDKIVVSADKLKLDKSVPENLSITYSTPVLQKILSGVTFGYYKPKVTVTLKAKDAISGISKFDWQYSKEAGASTSNVSGSQGTLDSVETLKDGSVQVQFELTAEQAKQYRGNISFSATDNAGWKTSYGTDKSNVLVVDTIAPQSTVSYSGNLIQMVTNDSHHNTVQTSSGDIKYIYKGDVTASFTITEMNFYPDDVYVNVRKSNGSWERKNVNWMASGIQDTYTGQIVLSGDGDYVIGLTYTDRSGNAMESYMSKPIAIDDTKPVIGVTYDNNDAVNGNYYNSVRTATIHVTEHNFRASEFIASITATDVQNKTVRDINDKTVADEMALLSKEESWTEIADDVWEAKVKFEKDAQYTFDCEDTDLAGNKSNDYSKDSFVVDLTKPSTDEMSIEYSTPVLQKVIQAITFGYYNPSVTVTLKAADNTSGVRSFSWRYAQEDGTSSVNVSSESGTLNEDQITYSDSGRIAEASFTLSAGDSKQYRGNIDFTASDRADNTSDEINDTSLIEVVDTISPTRSVEFSPANQVIDTETRQTISNYDYTTEANRCTLYYQGDATVTFHVNEANFYAEDIDLKISKDGNEAESVSIGNWSQSGDDWTGSTLISGDGDYIVYMSYTDRSGNIMQTYTSNIITIDTINPTIDVSYSPADAKKVIDGRGYYNEDVTATITVIEHNFRADDIAAILTSSDVTGANVSVADFASYLRSASNWSSNGDTHVASVTYSDNANYTFDISYKDLSLREAVDYNGDKFTVDKSLPANITISYSPSVQDKQVSATDYGYYNAPVTVTITAQDDTSGIYNFVYSYKNNSGVSKVNSELIDASINNTSINYSDGGKTATAVFTIPQAALDSNNQFCGTVSVTANDRSTNLAKKEDSRVEVVDNIAPTASITYNAPVTSVNDISYYSGDITATIIINEANFYAEDVIVTVAKNGAQPTVITPSAWHQDGDNWTGTISLSGDGDYIIDVQYKDRSDNTMKRYTSNQLTIDTTQPTVTVQGIKADSANKEDQIGFTLVAEDTNFDNGAFTPELYAIEKSPDGIFETDKIDLGEENISDDKKTYSYSVSNLDKDAIYTMTCKLADMSGNSTDQMSVTDSDNQQMDTLMFSINRQGSTFMLDKDTSNLVNDFYTQNVNDDVVITEINVDPIDEYKVAVNGKELKENEDFTATKSSNDGEWAKNVYDVKSAVFSDEGEYSTVVTSVDKTNTTAYSDLNNAEAKFVVDRTAPTVITSGITHEGRYQTSQEAVTLIPKDDGGKLSNLTVNISGDKNEISKDVLNLSDDKLESTLEENDNKVVFNVEEGMYQNITITCTDKAGNVYTSGSEYSDVTVSPNWLVIAWANRMLRYGVIGGLTGAAAGVFIIIVVKKKRRKDEK